MWNRRRSLAVLTVIVALVGVSVAAWPFLRNLGQTLRPKSCAIIQRNFLPDAYAITPLFFVSWAKVTRRRCPCLRAHMLTYEITVTCACLG